MQKQFRGAIALGVFIAACGGESQMAAPPPPPAPPPPAAEPVAAPTPAVTPAPAPKASLADLQKASVTNMMAAFAAHDSKKIAEAYAPDAACETPGPMGMEKTQGREAIAKMHDGLFKAFPDMKMTTTRVFQKGDVVIQEWVSTGTHKGDFMGMKASEKPIGLHGVTVSWYNDEGLIKKDHTYYDAATIGIQTGAEKGKARAVPAVPAGEPTWMTAKGNADETKNVDAVKAFYGTMEKKVEKDFLAALTDDVTHVNYNEADDRTGKEATKKEFQMMNKAFPDAKLNIENAWGFDNLVVVENTMTGTNKGPIGTVRATNKPVTMHAVDVLQLKDGKVAKVWTYQSNLEMMGQLGMLKAPVAAKADAKPVKAAAKTAAPAVKPVAPTPATKAVATTPATAKPAAAAPATKPAAPKK